MFPIENMKVYLRKLEQVFLIENSDKINIAFDHRKNGGRFMIKALRS